MGELEDALQRATANTATRPIPKSAQAQMRFLLKSEKGSTRALAARLGVTQRTVERYVKGTLRRPRKGLAARLEREVRKDWQPRVQQRAKKHAASRGPPYAPWLAHPPCRLRRNVQSGPGGPIGSLTSPAGR